MCNARYSDRVNFKEKHTREFDKLPLQKLFARLDTAQYIANLEAVIESHGMVRLAPLSSTCVLRVAMWSVYRILPGWSGVGVIAAIALTALITHWRVAQCNVSFIRLGKKVE